MGSIKDSRELIERREEIEAELELVEGDDGEEYDPLEPEERAELEEELEEINEAETSTPDFVYGAVMVPEEDFEDYARQFAEEIGAIPDDANWPCTCIDWEKAADDLRMDYTSVEYQGTTYYVR